MPTHFTPIDTVPSIFLQGDASLAMNNTMHCGCMMVLAVVVGVPIHVLVAVHRVGRAWYTCAFSFAFHLHQSHHFCFALVFATWRDTWIAAWVARDASIALAWPSHVLDSV
jgi:hypothetical protein